MRRPLFSFLAAVPIALLGGLIGLGGAEFRLPVLVAVLLYPARQAVSLNLAVSMITVLAALVIRAGALPTEALGELVVPILSLIAGAVPAAAAGASLAGRLSEYQFRQVVMLLLGAIGCLLLVEAFLPASLPALLPAACAVQIAAGVLLGVVIGIVSSVLG